MITYSNTKARFEIIREAFTLYQKEIFASGYFFDATYTKLLASALIHHTGYQYAIPVANGTSALYVIACFYRQWYNKVLTTPVTYQATYNAFMRAGFDIQTTSVDRYLLGDFKTRNNILNVPVGLFGKQPTYNPYNLVIEDACQNWILSQSSVTKAVSFDPTKNIASCGNGGAILTNAQELYEYATKFIRNNRRYNGLNLRMSELECAYVFAQMGYINLWQTKRREIALKYNTLFKSSLFDDSENHDIQKYVIHETELYKARELGLETKQMYPENPLVSRYHALPIYPELDITEFFTPI